MNHRSIALVEGSSTFQDLLLFVYPDKTPTVFSNVDPIQVIDAATKYSMNGVMGDGRYSNHYEDGKS